MKLFYTFIILLVFATGCLGGSFMLSMKDQGILDGIDPNWREKISHKQRIPATTEQVFQLSDRAIDCVYEEGGGFNLNTVATSRKGNKGIYLDKIDPRIDIPTTVSTTSVFNKKETPVSVEEVVETEKTDVDVDELKAELLVLKAELKNMKEGKVNLLEENKYLKDKLIQNEKETVLRSRENLSKETLVEDDFIEEGSPLPVTVVENYNINTSGPPEIRRVIMSKDIVTVYERGRMTNIVSAGSPWDVTIVGDLPEQRGTVNGEDPVGELLPHNRNDLASNDVGTSDPNDSGAESDELLDQFR